jgi:serine/threonine protein kinase
VRQQITFTITDRRSFTNKSRGRRKRVSGWNIASIHRDSRSESIFLDYFTSPKIGGFATSRVLLVDLTLTVDHNSSSDLAPKLYVTENVEELIPVVDVYSFGLILCELIVG